MSRAIALAALASLTFACSSAEPREAAEAEVQRFHRLFNRGDAAQLYAGASEELKRITPQEDFVRLMTELHAEFGNVRDASRRSWSAETQSGERTIKLAYDTRFERGEGSEEFTYRRESGRPILVTYKIRSEGAEPANSSTSSAPRKR